jgi:hypothetical protein
MTTYFTQEEPLNVNGTFVFDPHGNVIELDENNKMVRRELELKGILPNPFPYKCSICYKNVKSKDFTHYRCRDVLAKLEKAKKNVVNLEFKLFCLRYTDKDVVNLDTYNIDD